MLFIKKQVMFKSFFTYLIAVLLFIGVVNACSYGKNIQYEKHIITIERIIPHQYFINGRWQTQYECWWRSDNKILLVTFETDTSYYWIGRTETAYIRR